MSVAQSFLENNHLIFFGAIAFKEYGRAKRARLETTSALTSGIQSEYHGLSKAFGNMTRHVKNAADSIASEVRCACVQLLQKLTMVSRQPILEH